MLSHYSQHGWGRATAGSASVGVTSTATGAGGGAGVPTVLLSSPSSSSSGATSYSMGHSTAASSSTSSSSSSTTNINRASSSSSSSSSDSRTSLPLPSTCTAAITPNDISSKTVGPYHLNPAPAAGTKASSSNTKESIASDKDLEPEALALQLSQLSHEELQVVYLVQEELVARGEHPAAVMSTMMSMMAEGVHAEVRNMSFSGGMKVRASM